MKFRQIIKNLLRTPIKTGLLLLILTATSFLFISRIGEYYVTSDQLHKAEGYYKTSGTIRASQERIDRINNELRAKYGFASNQTADTTELAQEEMAILQDVNSISLLDIRKTGAAYCPDIVCHPEPATISAGSLYLAMVEITIKQTDYVFAHRRLDITATVDKVIAAHQNYILPNQEIIISNSHWEDWGESETKPITREEFIEGLEVGKSYFAVIDVATIDYYGIDSYAFGEAYPKINGLPYYPLETAPKNYLTQDMFNTPEDKYNNSINDYIAAINKNIHTFDAVYTGDMSAINAVADGSLFYSSGRGITAADNAENAKVCVISADVATNCGLSVGDKLPFTLKNYSGSRGAYYSIYDGFNAEINRTDIPEQQTDLEIIGIYSYLEYNPETVTENAYLYHLSTIFLPSSLYKADNSKDAVYPHTLSFILRTPNDAAALKDTLKTKLAEKELELVLHDNGWENAKDGFRTMKSSATVGVIVMGTAALLSLVVAIYLFCVKRKGEYAIMRALGNTAKRSGSVLLKGLEVLGIVAIAMGGTMAFVMSKSTAAAVLAKATTAGVLPMGFAFTGSVPIWLILAVAAAQLCLLIIAAKICIATFSHCSPLKLLQAKR